MKFPTARRNRPDRRRFITQDRDDGGTTRIVGVEDDSPQTIYIKFDRPISWPPNADPSYAATVFPFEAIKDGDPGNWIGADTTEQSAEDQLTITCSAGWDISQGWRLAAPYTGMFPPVEPISGTGTFP